MKTKVSTPAKKEFTRLLLKWNRDQNTRQMPWKGEKDPYKIWLSEIILQQTRVDQGLAYYHAFIQQFPDIDKLARAREEKVFKLWEGLGYYSRCRNLIATARYISNVKKGVFPDNYKDILDLKGVGPYTAAAISSFGFNLPHAVVDGNVFRVLARVFGIDALIDTTTGKQFFSELANELLDKKQPGLYNQAIMDFGAVICKPALPSCGECVFRKNCIAFREGKINELPVKEKRTAIRHRWFYFLVLEYGNEVAIRQRTQKDIWQRLYEFPLIETGKSTRVSSLRLEASKRKWAGPRDQPAFVSGEFRQQLSHQLIRGKFLRIKISKKPSREKDWIWVAPGKLSKFAFPQFIRQYLRTFTTKGNPRPVK